MSEVTKNLTILDWVFMGFVIVGTAARESGLIVDPWGAFIGSIIALLYAYGIVSRPNPKKT